MANQKSLKKIAPISRSANSVYLGSQKKSRSQKRKREEERGERERKEKERRRKQKGDEKSKEKSKKERKGSVRGDQTKICWSQKNQERE